MTDLQILRLVQKARKHTAEAVAILDGLREADVALVLFHLGEAEGALVRLQGVVDPTEQSR